MYLLLYKGHAFKPQRTLSDCFALLCSMGENDIKQAYLNGYEIIQHSQTVVGVA